MHFDTIQNHISCPYRTVMSLNKKESFQSDLDVFHNQAIKLLSDIFSDSLIFLTPIKMNNHIDKFEKRLTKGKKITSPKDLLIRKAIKSTKSLLNSIDSNQIIKVYGPRSFIIDLQLIAKINIFISGYLKMEHFKTKKPYYNFYVYDPYTVSEGRMNSLKARLLHQAIIDARFIDNDLLKDSNIIFIDSYKETEYTYSLSKYSGICSMEHLESICLAIKLGIFYPSPSASNCSECLYRKTCPHASIRTGSKDKNVNIENIILQNIDQINEELLNELL